MRRRSFPAGILALLFAAVLATGVRAELALSVMTFNLRNSNAKDGEDHWDKRKDFAMDVIRDSGADVVGVQEAFAGQLDDLRGGLPGFGQIGEGRDGGRKGEHCTILFRKDRFRVDESGTFWLSETPEKPSITWGNACVRVCTWARLVEKQSGEAFYLFNTHLDHRSQPSREKSVRLIAQRIAARAHRDPVVLTGDFNAGEKNPVVTYLTGEKRGPLLLRDSFRVVHPGAAEVGTGGGFGGRRDGAKIDYIFVEPGTRVSAAAIVRTERDGRFPSDHFPVTARLHLRGE